MSNLSYNILSDRYKLLLKERNKLKRENISFNKKMRSIKKELINIKKLLRGGLS